MLNFNDIKIILSNLKGNEEKLKNAFGYSDWNAEVKFFKEALNLLDKEAKKYANDNITENALIKLNHDLNDLIRHGKRFICPYGKDYPDFLLIFSTYDSKIYEALQKTFEELGRYKTAKIEEIKNKEDVDMLKEAVVKNSSILEERETRYETQEKDVKSAMVIFGMFKSISKSLEEKSISEPAALFQYNSTVKEMNKKIDHMMNPIKPIPRPTITLSSGSNQPERSLPALR